MAKNKVQKGKLMSDLDELVKKGKSAVFTVNKSLNAEEMVALRQKMHANQSQYIVPKKTILKLVLTNNKIDIPEDVDFSGPINAAFNFEDEIQGIKLIYEFSKTTENLEIVGGIFEGKIVNKVTIEQLANLPSKDQLRARLVGSLNSPISGFVNVIFGPLRGFATVVGAIKDKKEANA